MSFDLDARLADWRKSLLDTTKRNRLIKFVAGRVGGVHLVHPPAAEVWKRLVHDGGTLTFPWKRELLGLPREVVDADALAIDFDPVRGTADGDAGELARELTALCLRSAQLRPTHVLTDFSDRQLAARLLRLARSAQESETDHGVTTLYAAFGFLRWYDSPQSDEECLSPLVLVPVRLRRDTIESPFAVQIAEDEVLPNHCLAELLAAEFKLKLPTTAEHPLDSDDAACYASYLERVRERIAPMARWAVEDRAAIGVFNFQKLAMWHDLGRNAARITSHPLCRVVAGDATATRPPVGPLPAAEELDRVVTPAAARHILDADSSQHEAIEAVKRGADLVIDGPPGTGKSQTIANIIAETLAAGKTVLFVSAKVAALEVVKRRLDGCGLGDFCLELHSHKANKKEVIAELGRCLELDAEGMPLTESLLQEVGEVRARLNEVVAELHAVRQPLGWSAFRVHGELARLFREDDTVTGWQGDKVTKTEVSPVTLSPCHPVTVSFSKRSRLAISEPLAKDSAYVSRAVEILTGLADCHAVLDEPGGHPWRGCKVIVATHLARDEAAHALREFASAIPDAQEAAEKLATAGFAAPPLTVRAWSAAEGLAQRILAAPVMPAEWFRSDPHAAAAATIRLDRATRDARDALQHLPGFSRDAVWGIENVEAVSLSSEQERLVSGGTLTARERLPVLARIRESFEKLRDQANAVDALAREVATILRLGTVPSFREFAGLTQVAGRVAVSPAMPLSWWDPVRRAELVAAATRAAEDERTALSQRPTLVARLAPAALAAESSPLARAAGEAAQSFWRWLPWSRWNSLRKSVASWYSLTLPAGAVMRADMVELATYHRRIDSVKQVAEAYRTELVANATGEIDWSTTLASLADVEQLGQWKVATDFKALAGSGGSLDRKTLQARTTALTQALETFASTWKALLADWIVPQPETVLAKPAADVLAWLAAETAAVARDAAVLGRLPPLFLDAADLPAAAIRDRLVRLRQLVVARDVIVASAATIQDSRYPRDLAEVNFAQQAADAAILLDILKELTQPLTPGMTRAFTDPGTRERLGEVVRKSVAARPAFDKTWQRIATELFDPDATVSTNIVLTNAALADLKSWADARVADMDRLAEWARFLQVERDAAAFGIGGVLDEVKAGEYGPRQAADAFRARFYRLWLDALHQTVPVLGAFTAAAHERLIARFVELDRLAIRTAPARLRSERLAHPERPRTRDGAPEASELGILLREVHKKQRHLPLRRLFAHIPWLLPRLKPCLMMSPLAVSTYLDDPELGFDLVIFDEASQVRPHDAICAIYRGRQLVVGGDPRQLPPTDFFNRADDGDDEPSAETEAPSVPAASATPALPTYESLLDVCLARGLTRKWLRWHYRSRREGLIAFANRYIYEGRLVTFPSAEEAAGPAIAFIKVEDGRFKDGVNPVEAKRIAGLVLEHARTSPHLSLGVIAFSLRQQERILDELEVLRRQHPETESFFSGDGPEPFFVKNLENVQGDERDAIVLGVGYGPDATGKVAMRFGPLNQQGGERRLNVAITRARRAMTVVSSIAAADIDLARTRAEGAKLLRAFLDYAARGPAAFGEAIDRVGGDAESPFEYEVGEELVRRGLAIQRQVGCGGYRIDLAIVDGQGSGKYLLGVECDGAAYHSAATARDRDRLRQAVLEGLGWRLVRVWSSDWIRDREKQVQRILAALAQAQSANAPTAMGEPEVKTAPVEKMRKVKPVEFEEIDVVPEAAIVDAITHALIAYGSMPADDLAAAVSRALGFKRTGPKIRDRIIPVVNDLTVSGRVMLDEASRVRLHSLQ